MNLQPGFRRTRIAPTPSGFLHLGNVLSFAITAALARRTGAKILLRIDDLDRERVEGRFVEDIFETLHFLEMPWDEGPGDFHEYETRFSKVHRMDVYRAALEELRQRRAEIESLRNERTEPIAVIGMACRFPGGCDTPEQFWQLLDQGRHGITEVPPARWNVDEYYDADPAVPGKGVK